MFSVIIPSYNKLDFISTSIQSVLNQTLQDFEIIIVDDGSTDGTRDFLKKSIITNSNIRVIFQENTGVSSARNNGAKVAKYEYLAFLDADDWWEKTFLEEMKSFIENYPNAGLYSSNFSIVKNGNRIESKFNIKSGYIDYFKSYVTCGFRQPINSSSVIIPKVVFEDMAGFSLDIKRGEDFHFWTKIALNEKVAYYNKPLSNYNQDSNINFRATKKVHPPVNNYVYYFSEFKEFEKNNGDLKKLLDHIRLGNYRNYIRNRKFSEYAKELLKDVDMSKIPFFSRIYYKIPPNPLSLLILIEIYFLMFKKKIYLLNPNKKYKK